MNRMKTVFILVLLLFLLSSCVSNASSSTESAWTSSVGSSEESSAANSTVGSVTSSGFAVDTPVSTVTSSHNSEPIYACAGEVTLDGKTFSVEVVQIEAVQFDREKYPLCASVGKFDLVVRDASGNEMHRQNLNELYENKMIGYWGVGYKEDDKMNFLTNTEKTQCVFGVMVGHGQDGACIMFSLDKTCDLKVLPVKGGYAYTDSMSNHMDYGISPTINHFGDINGNEYVWNGGKYILLSGGQSSPAKIIKGQNSLVSYNFLSVGKNAYTVEIMQTKMVTPDSSVNYWTYGDYNLVVKDENGKETDKVCLNDYFDGKPMSHNLGNLQLLYNQSGSQVLFGIAGSIHNLIEGSWLQAIVLLRLDEFGTISRLPVQDGYVYSTMDSLPFNYGKDTFERFAVNLSENQDLLYTWNGDKYVRKTVTK